MNRKILIRTLTENGWVITHGAKHDIARHSKIKGMITIPRHSEISKGTMKSILKTAKLN